MSSDSTTPATAARLTRWRAPLVNLLFYLIMIESMTGFALYFFGHLIPGLEILGEVHWWLGVVFIVPYAVYQLRHYLRVANFKGRLHFYLGLTTFIFMTATILSGVWLWWVLRDNPVPADWIVLVHVVIGFALLCIISGHLTVVFRVGRRHDTEALDAAQNEIVGRALWWPLLLATVLVILLPWFF